MVQMLILTKQVCFNFSSDNDGFTIIIIIIIIIINIDKRDTSYSSDIWSEVSLKRWEPELSLVVGHMDQK